MKRDVTENGQDGVGRMAVRVPGLVLPFSPPSTFFQLHSPIRSLSVPLPAADHSFSHQSALSQQARSRDIVDESRIEDSSSGWRHAPDDPLRLVMTKPCGRQIIAGLWGKKTPIEASTVAKKEQENLSRSCLFRIPTNKSEEN